ncbi:MAG: flagellin [Alphaproteobacteria bacterium]
MALTVATNTGALTAQAAASSVNKEMETAMNRLSTGQRVNSAADDAAGVAISSRMTAQINGLNQAIRNAGDGISMVSTGEGAMIEIEAMLQRMRELAVQSANDTVSTSDRTNLNAEVGHLKAEIDAIVSRTQFNGKALLDGSLDASLQVGSSTGQTLDFKIAALSTSTLGTSVSSTSAIQATANIAEGTQATETVSTLSFNGNDSYGMKITIGNGTATENFTIANSVVTGNSATDVANDMNAAFTALISGVGYAGSLKAGDFVASANGNVVTMTNKLGDSIAISSFTSSANGTASYVSLSGTGNSVLLDETAAVTSASNSGGSAATVATSDLSLAANKSYNFKVNGTDIAVTNYTAVGGTSQADLLAAIKLAIGDGSAGSAAKGGSATDLTLKDSTGQQISITNFVPTTSPQGSKGAMVLTVRVDADNDTASETFASGGTDKATITDKTDIVQLSFTEAEADYSFKITAGAKNYTATVATASAGKTLQEALAVTRDAINADATANTTGIIARLVDGKLEIETGTDGATIDTFTSTGKAAVTAGASSFAGVDLVAVGSASTTNGVRAVASEMTMSFSGDDTYSFKINGTVITGAVVNGDFSAITSAVNSNTGATGVTAQASNGTMLLKDADGTAINITNFTSSGSGSVQVSNASGQGSSTILDDTAAVAAANTAAAGKATATTMDLSMDSSDKVTFHISDGRTNAVVRLTQFDPANNAAVISEINSALKAVGSDITVAAGPDVTATGNGTADEKVVLTNSTGGKIEITNFTSDGSGKMTASPASGQGVAKILSDDGLSSSQASIATQSVLTKSASTNMMSAVDRALEQLSAERSKLGAIANRLDHSINSLTETSVQTTASRGRIVDADFAAETSNLAKFQILQQASMAMLAQANAAKQNVLSLLQG